MSWVLWGAFQPPGEDWGTHFPCGAGTFLLTAHSGALPQKPSLVRAAASSKHRLMCWYKFLIPLPHYGMSLQSCPSFRAFLASAEILSSLYNSSAFPSARPASPPCSQELLPTRWLDKLPSQSHCQVAHLQRLVPSIILGSRIQIGFGGWVTSQGVMRTPSLAVALWCVIWYSTIAKMSLVVNWDGMLVEWNSLANAISQHLKGSEKVTFLGLWNWMMID